MSPEETERLLASAPTRRLSPEAERRILNAVVASSAARPANWWLRRIPLWQATAACILLCAATFALARGLGRISKSSESKSSDRSATRAVVADQPKIQTTLVQIDQPLFGRRTRPPYRTDIARWSTQTVNRKKRN